MADADSRTERILDEVRVIPKGFVRAYSDVDPQAPRAVGRVLATIHDESLPWHRVVRADGTIPMGERQAELLRRERVPMRGARVDLPQARYPASAPAGIPGPRRASLATAIAAVAAADPAMDALVRRAGRVTWRPRNPDGHFGALVRSITFQQLAGPAASAIHGRVRALIDGPLDAAALTRVPDADLRGAGLSAAKLASLRDLSAKVLDGTVILDDNGTLGDEEIIARLVTVRGIGRWTAEMYLMFELRRLDLWPVDDLGVRQGYGIAWSIDPPPPARRMGPLGDRFRPYRSVAARYCWEAVHLSRASAATSLR